MGLGSFGGGEGLVQWLLSEGAHVLIADLAELTSLKPTLDRIAQVAPRRPEVHTGPHCTGDFTDTDLVVVNPAVPKPWTNPFLNAARAHGVPCTTAMRLLIERLPKRDHVVGITGSVGKSTTATMLRHALNHMGFDARLGGNIGGSLLPTLDTMTNDTWIVLECSSAQLHWLDASTQETPRPWPGWSPHIALTTNIAPNHLDWHGDEAAYTKAKAVIHRFQRVGDVSIESSACDRLGPIALRVKGEHNQANARLALAGAMAATGLSLDQLSDALLTFSPLDHRLQPVDDATNPRFWNDAKSSTPEATLLALKSFGDDVRNVHLIAGGYDKGVSLDAIATMAPTLAGLYCIGSTGPGLADAANAAGGQVYACETLDHAVEQALHNLGRDGQLLLSPGCASWDQFKDFRARGERFISLVTTHLAGA
jgi:UDP-N-acetylmuramoylalanine--D-glutamate ligase